MYGAFAIMRLGGYPGITVDKPLRVFQNLKKGRDLDRRILDSGKQGF